MTDWETYLRALPALGGRIVRAKPAKGAFEEIYASAIALSRRSGQAISQTYVGQVFLEVVVFQPPVYDPISKADLTTTQLIEQVAARIALELPMMVNLDPSGLKIAGPVRLVSGFPADAQWSDEAQCHYCVLEFEYTVLARPVAYP